LADKKNKIPFWIRFPKHAALKQLEILTRPMHGLRRFPGGARPIYGFYETYWSSNRFDAQSMPSRSHAWMFPASDSRPGNR